MFAPPVAASKPPSDVAATSRAASALTEALAAIPVFFHDSFGAGRPMSGNRAGVVHLYIPSCGVPSSCRKHKYRTAMSNTMRRRKSAMVESSDDDEDFASPRGPPPGGSFSSAAPQNSVAVAESRLRKVLVRSVVGFFMVTSFVGIVWAGHLYLSALVVLIQVGGSYHSLPIFPSCAAGAARMFTLSLDRAVGTWPGW